MSDLDQPLADAFARRASMVSGSVLSPETVRRGVRRQRLRTAQISFATSVAVVVAMAGVVSGLDRHHRAGPTTQKPQPSPSITADASLVAKLPWIGAVPLELRTNSDGPGYVGCLGAACQDLVAGGPHAITLSDDNGAILGLAPAGTHTVIVQLGNDHPLVAQTAVATADHRDAGVLFGLPTVSLQEPAGSAFTRSYRITAYDPDGHVLATMSMLGGVDLARLHSPAGPVLTLSSDSPNDPALVAWGDESGWACWGERAAGHHADYAAYSCIPPTGPARLTMVGQDDSRGAVVLRVPRGETKVELRNAAGVAADSRARNVGHVALAYLDIWPAEDATIVGLDAKGRVVESIPATAMQLPAGAITTPGRFG